MKYIKTYENASSTEEWWSQIGYPYQDNYLKINQIKKGVNKGLIKFYFWDDKRYRDGDWYKLSFISGCAVILDTEYEKNPQIRQIILGPSKFRKITTNTSQKVIVEFLKDLGYEDIETVQNVVKRKKWNFLEIIRRIEENFENEIKVIAEKSNTLGDVLDNLRMIREKIFDFERENYEKWELEQATKKYNL